MLALTENHTKTCSTCFLPIVHILLRSTLLGQNYSLHKIHQNCVCNCFLTCGISLQYFAQKTLGTGLSKSSHFAFVWIVMCFFVRNCLHWSRIWTWVVNINKNKSTPFLTNSMSLVFQGVTDYYLMAGER